MTQTGLCAWSPGYQSNQSGQVKFNIIGWILVFIISKSYSVTLADITFQSI